MSAWKTFVALVWWDWVREMKRKNTLISMGMMGLITLFLFSFAIPPTRTVLLDTRSGILWVTFLLAGTIGIERAFRGGDDGRLLEGLLLAPIGRATLYYARVASTLLFVVTLQAMLLLLFVVLFDESFPGPGLASLALGGLATTFGFVTVGVLFSAMTRSIRGGDVLLRILLFPMLLPVFASAISLTDRAFEGQWAGPREIGVLVAFDLVFLGAGHVLFEHVVKEIGPQ